MKKLNGPMKKEIVCLMCENIKSQNVDIDKLAIEDPEKAIEYVHGQYRIAQEVFKEKRSQYELQSENFVLAYTPFDSGI
jgi:hypothetical protein